MAELDAAAEAVNAIRQLCRDLSIPSRLRDIGAKEADFEDMAKLCVDANYNRWNPRNTSYHDFLGLFQRAF
jgi:alcohol dehydrogenase